MSSTKTATTNRSRRRGGKRGNNQNRNRGGNRRGIRRKPAPLTPWERFLGIFGIGPAAARKATRSKAAAEDDGDRRPQSGRVRVESTPGGKRQPVVHEVTSPRLYVGNLSYDAVEADIEEVFNGVGRVDSVEIVTNQRTQRSKGYGFVIMGSTEDAKRAVEVLHDQELMGRKMVVSGAKSEGKQETAA